MHLHDAQRALQQFAQTGARYLLTNVPWLEVRCRRILTRKEMNSTSSIIVYQKSKAIYSRTTEHLWTSMKMNIYEHLLTWCSQVFLLAFQCKKKHDFVDDVPVLWWPSPPFLSSSWEVDRVEIVDLRTLSWKKKTPKTSKNSISMPTICHLELLFPLNAIRETHSHIFCWLQVATQII